MGWNDPDVYYQPEKFGLTQIGQLEDPDASYSFDDLVVWRHEDGRLFWASDSGCSCPSPFEDYTSLDSLNLITEESWPEFQKAVEDHCAQWDYYWGPIPPDDTWTDGEFTSGRGERRWDRRKPDPGSFAADKTELLAKVCGALFGPDNDTTKALGAGSPTGRPRSPE